MDSSEMSPGHITAPFLRWAGGKRWLVKRLPEILGNFKICDYHEPFLGGGAMFFALGINGNSYLSDVNADLIETYEQVRDNPEKVAESLLQHENTEEHYYLVRSSKPATAMDRASKFIFLNHTSFNGIYRVNLRGDYNVPFGGRDFPKIPTKEQLLKVSGKLQNAVLRHCDFESAIHDVSEGDLVFLDPPYTVAHNNNGFIKYNQKLFSYYDQMRLSSVIDIIRDAGAFYVLTNAANVSIASLFEKGDRCMELTRRSSVAGSQAARGSAREFLFTNVPAHE